MFSSLPDAPGYFITGTNTEVGKTHIACQLLDHLNVQGKKAIGFKPVASGADRTPAGLRNEDGLKLQAHSHGTPDYDHINPIALTPPIAPHIAADQAGIELNVAGALTNLAKLQTTYQPGVTIVEGAGGWLVPLSDTETFADLAVAINYPVILVVRMLLGCINHALLSAQAIQNSGATLIGWVANSFGEPQPAAAENIATLNRWMPVPLIG